MPTFLPGEENKQYDILGLNTTPLGQYANTPEQNQAVRQLLVPDIISPLTALKQKVQVGADLDSLKQPATPPSAPPGFTYDPFANQFNPIGNYEQEKQLTEAQKIDQLSSVLPTIRTNESLGSVESKLGRPLETDEINQIRQEQYRLAQTEALQTGSEAQQREIQGRYAGVIEKERRAQEIETNNLRVALMRRGIAEATPEIFEGILFGRKQQNEAIVRSMESERDIVIDQAKQALAQNKIGLAANLRDQALALQEKAVQNRRLQAQEERQAREAQFRITGSLSDQLAGAMVSPQGEAPDTGTLQQVSARYGVPMDLLALSIDKKQKEVQVKLRGEAREEAKLLLDQVRQGVISLAQLEPQQLSDLELRGGLTPGLLTTAITHGQTSLAGLTDEEKKAVELAGREESLRAGVAPPTLPLTYLPWFEAASRAQLTRDKANDFSNQLRNVIGIAGALGTPEIITPYLQNNQPANQITPQASNGQSGWVNTVASLAGTNQETPIKQVETKKLASGIMVAEGYGQPGAAITRLNNPGALTAVRSDQYPGQSGIERVKGSDGISRNFANFKDFNSGYNALLEDLEVKKSGQSATGLTGNSTIAQLGQTWVSGIITPLPTDPVGVIVNSVKSGLRKFPEQVPPLYKDAVEKQLQVEGWRPPDKSEDKQAIVLSSIEAALQSINDLEKSYNALAKKNLVGTYQQVAGRAVGPILGSNPDAVLFNANRQALVPTVTNILVGGGQRSIQTFTYYDSLVPNFGTNKNVSASQFQNLRNRLSERREAIKKNPALANEVLQEGDLNSGEK